MTVRSGAKSIAMIAALAACGGESPTSPPSQPSTPTTPTTPTQPTQPTTPTTPTNPSNPNASYTLVLGLPGGTPSAGSKVTVYIVAKRDPSAAKVGSFSTVLVPSDTSAIGFAAQVDRTSDGLVAMNGQITGVTAVAGAAANGFSNDTLAAISMNLKKANGLQTLTLIIRELTTAAFEDKTAGATAGPPSSPSVSANRAPVNVVKGKKHP